MTPMKMPKRIHALLWLLYSGIALDLYYFYNLAFSSSVAPFPTLYQLTWDLLGVLLSLTIVKLTWSGRRAGWVLLVALNIFAPLGFALFFMLIVPLHEIFGSEFVAVFPEVMFTEESRRMLTFMRWFDAFLVVVVVILPLLICGWALLSKKSLSYFGYERVPARETGLAALLVTFLFFLCALDAEKMRNSWREDAQRGLKELRANTPPYPG